MPGTAPASAAGSRTATAARSPARISGGSLHGAFGTVGVDAPAVVVADTIGAGDSFSAGWLAWWTEHGLGRDALADRDAVVAATAFACRAAAITCSRAGADPPRRDELP